MRINGKVRAQRALWSRLRAFAMRHCLRHDSKTKYVFCSRADLRPTCLTRPLDEIATHLSRPGACTIPRGPSGNPPRTSNSGIAFPGNALQHLQQRAGGQPTRLVIDKRVPRAFKPWQMLISSTQVCYHGPGPAIFLQLVHGPMTRPHFRRINQIGTDCNA